MSKYGSDKAAIYVDGYNLSGLTTDVDVEISAMTEETHGLGDAWTETEPTGLKRAKATQKGFYDDAALQSNAALVTQFGTSRIMCVLPADNVKARKLVGFAGAMQVDYKRIVSRGQLHKVDVTYEGNGQVSECVILVELATHTAADDSTAAYVDDNGAASAAGLVGFLQVTALTLGGYTNAIVTILDSADHVTFATLQAFAATTAAPSAQRVTKSGTVRRYLAVSLTWTGSGSGQSISFLVGLARG